MSVKNVVITGASTGVGEALSLRLAAAGMKVFALARGKEKLESLAKGAKGAIVTFAADVTRPEQIRAAYETIESQHGPIDALVNNAAVFEMKDFVEQDLETMDRIIDTNLKGTLYCTRLALPYMLKRKRGRIVNIASVAGTRGIAQQAAYCASKHGVSGFADALAQELRPHGIVVTTLCPGGIDTPLWRTGQTRYPGDLSKTMKPQEVAELVEFILTRPAGTSYKKVIFFPNNEWH